MAAERPGIRAWFCRRLTRPRSRGLYLFNHFNKDKDFNVRSPDGKRILRNDHRAIMDGIGDLNALLACPRRHVLTYDDTTAPGVPNPKQLPAVLASAAPLTLRIHTGPEPAAGRAVLRLGLDDLPEVAEARLRVRMNGAACLPLPDMEQPAGYRRDPKSPEVWLLSQVARRLLQFDVPLTAINRGDNSVDLSLENGPQQKIIWAEMYLDPGSTATDRRVPGSANTAEDDPHKPKSP